MFFTLGSQLDNYPFDRSVELPDWPEEGSRILESIFDGYLSEKVEFFEIESGFFTLRIELNPRKTAPTRPSKHDKRTDNRDDSKCDQCVDHTKSIEPPLVSFEVCFRYTALFLSKYTKRDEMDQW